MKSFCTVRLRHETLRVQLSKPTLLESLQAAKIKIESSCGGNGTCTTCMVKVESWARPVPPRTELEQERAEERDFRDNERLSCQLESRDCIDGIFSVQNISED